MSRRQTMWLLLDKNDFAIVYDRKPTSYFVGLFGSLDNFKKFLDRNEKLFNKYVIVEDE